MAMKLTLIRMTMVALSLNRKTKILTSRGQQGAQNQDPHEGKLAGTFEGKLLVKFGSRYIWWKIYTMLVELSKTENVRKLSNSSFNIEF